MAKSGKAKLDLAVAEELGLELGSQMLTLNHVKYKAGTGGGFLFVYEHAGLHLIDMVSVWRDTHGVRFKPERLIMPSVVPERLKKHHYLRWYFGEGSILHPVQIAKIEKLFDEFLFVIDHNPLYRPIPIITERLHLRKKPLRGLFPQHFQWPDSKQRKVT